MSRIRTAEGVLRDMLKRLAKPECWTQGHTARDKAGRPVSSFAENARCWCLYGAYIEVDGDDSIKSRAWIAMTDAAGYSPITFNDIPSRTHAQVLALLKTALKRVTC